LLLRRCALNRVDLILGLTAVLVATIAAVVLLVSDDVQKLLFRQPVGKDLAAPILAGWVAIVLACVGAAIKITSTRWSLISLLTAEIRALQFGLSNMHMFEFWAAIHGNPERGAFGFADVPRNENYFQLFQSVSENIGNLGPNVVDAIVRFYTYLKMSRDAAAALHSWKEQNDPAIRRVHVAYVIQLLTLSMLWGFVALWFMGARANKYDRDFLKRIQAAYSVTIGSEAFVALVTEPARYAALARFFPPGDLPLPPQPVDS
jgi:hypothetical protein